MLTQQGHPVRILATDVCGWRTYRPHLADGDNTQERELRNDLIIGLVRKPNGVDETRRWTPEGFELNEDAIYNLVNRKVKKWRWVMKTRSISSWVTEEHWSEERVKEYTAKYGFAIIGRILESEIEE